jgi:hypothetical protein
MSVQSKLIAIGNYCGEVKDYLPYDSAYYVDFTSNSKVIAYLFSSYTHSGDDVLLDICNKGDNPYEISVDKNAVFDYLKQWVPLEDDYAPFDDLARDIEAFFILYQAGFEFYYILE